MRKHMARAALVAGLAAFSCRLMAVRLSKIFELQEEVKCFTSSS
jgi:hypothetical protein